LESAQVVDDLAVKPLDELEKVRDALSAEIEHIQVAKMMPKGKKLVETFGEGDVEHGRADPRSLRRHRTQQPTMPIRTFEGR
jgi:hypothetical protein